MKKYLLLFVLGIMLVCSCSKGEDPPIEEPSPFWGITSAMKNGISWTADPYAKVNINHGNGLSFESVKHNQFNLREESLGFFKVPFIPGDYSVVNTIPQDNDSKIGAAFFFVDHDVVLGHYEILESDSSSFITLTSYDTLSQEVKGSFDLTFIVKNKNDAYNFPDTVRFRNGNFHTKVTEL